MRARWLAGATAAVCLVTGAMVGERWQAHRIAYGSSYGVDFVSGIFYINWEARGGGVTDRASSLIEEWRSCSWWGSRNWLGDWVPRDTYPEILARFTGQRLPNDPDIWSAWLAAHPNLVPDDDGERFVEPWRETTVYRLPEGAKSEHVFWKLNLEGCSRQGNGLQVLRTEEEFREFLGSCSHRFPVELLLKWNAIDFSKRMAIVAFGTCQDPLPWTVATAFEKDGVLWVTELEMGKPYTIDGPLPPYRVDPSVITSCMGGIVLARTDLPVKYWSGPLPRTVTREPLKPSRISP